MQNYIVQENKGFTLIELVVVITISAIILVATYAPYVYYQNKAKLKIANKEVSQSLYEARNMAINGLYDVGEENKNVGIGIFVDAENKPNNILFFTYPYSMSGSEIVPRAGSEIRLLKEEILPPGVQIERVNSEKNALFFFEAITGKGSYTYFDEAGERHIFLDETVEILMSYKGAENENLQTRVKYFTPTNIVDY